MKTQTGRCACEAIHYEVTGEPLFTHACHCTQCQRRSGAAFCMSMLLEARQLNITQGKTATFEIASDSGNMKVLHFCGNCGIMVFGHTVSQPNILFFRPGTLDDTSRIKAQAHIWVRSKQPWLVLPGDVPCFETMYDRASVWPEESLRRFEVATG